MSLSWTPFLNEFFSCLLLALLFSVILLHVFLPCCWEILFSPAVNPLFCHSSRRSGSTPITVFWISSFFALSSTILFHRPIVWLLVIFSGIIQSGHVCPNCWLQLELCSLHGVAAPPHALPRAARPVHAHHTLCLQSSSALGRYSFKVTTTLLVSSCVHLT